MPETVPNDADTLPNPPDPRARFTPVLVLLLTVALTFAGLLVGYRPIGGDPDTMYRPMKVELAAALRANQLPLWSDHFGLGAPLAAESHVAAFYPPNWAAYRFLSVPDAYAALMWLNLLALALSTYAYARSLGLDRPGAALAGLVFSLCGFQAIHIVHEPFLNALPYLPLCLLIAENYAARGGIGWIAALGLAWGAQLTVGHFQLPFWTGALVLLTGGWRIIPGRRPLRRLAGLAAGLFWGVLIAFVQLALTEELTRVSSFNRPPESLILMSFPPPQWVQTVVPALFFDFKGDMTASFWAEQLTIGSEAVFYVGTLPLILAVVGWIGGLRVEALRPWKVIAVAAALLASLPRLWPEAYLALLNLPGLGWFRAPARYTMLTSLALALFAGNGLHRTVSAVRFRFALTIALTLALAGFAAAVWITTWPAYQASVNTPSLGFRFGTAALSWTVALAALWLWRRRFAGWLLPVAVAALELAVLLYHAPVQWGWDRNGAEASPLLRWIKNQPNVGLVGGPLKNVPVATGLTTAYPYFGITPPPPNYLLEFCESLDPDPPPEALRKLRRFGVTHLVWPPGTTPSLGQAAHSTTDAVLDRMLRPPVPGGEWTVTRVPDAMPSAWVARSARVTAQPDEFGWAQLFAWIRNEEPTTDVAHYQRGQEPAPSTTPHATEATLTDWDGRRAIVDHNGACDLIIRRDWYPGWTARVDGGPWRAPARADGGLQAVRLDGTGTSRVEFRFEPTTLASGRILSLTALAAACLTLAGTAARRHNLRPRPNSGTRSPSTLTN